MKHSSPQANVQGGALKTSLKPNKDDSIASNGWLDTFVSQHKIKMANLHGVKVQYDMLLLLS